MRCDAKTEAFYQRWTLTHAIRIWITLDGGDGVSMSSIQFKEEEPGSGRWEVGGRQWGWTVAGAALVCFSRLSVCLISHTLSVCLSVHKEILHLLISCAVYIGTELCALPKSQAAKSWFLCQITWLWPKRTELGPWPIPFRFHWPSLSLSLFEPTNNYFCVIDAPCRVKTRYKLFSMCLRWFGLEK